MFIFKQKMRPVTNCIEVPVSCSSAVRGCSAGFTSSLRSILRGPTHSFQAVPSSSAFAGALSSLSLGSSNDDDYGASLFMPAPHPLNEDDAFREDIVSTSIELLSQAVAFPIYQEFALAPSVKHKKSSIGQDFHCAKIPPPPPVVNSFSLSNILYIEVCNIADDVLVLEDLHSSEASFDEVLPLELDRDERRSFLLRLTKTESCCKSITELDTIATSKLFAIPEQLHADTVRGDSEDLPQASCYLRWHLKESKEQPQVSRFWLNYRSCNRRCIDVSISCRPSCRIGTILSAVVNVTNCGGSIVDLVALLPKDLQFHRSPSVPNAAVEPPPLVSLSARKDLGVLNSNVTRSTELLFLVTIGGMHAFPPIMILDRLSGKRYLMHGDPVVHAH